ncbi:MAG: periplasmic heavy metal sensor [Candidatus Solibacter usitatus]|nr:periplasmic heavy metal sensor [Candidatus Solibacter usitatus]
MRILLLLLISISLAAQDSTRGQRRGGPPSGDPNRRKAFLADVMASQLSLSKEQRKQLESILDKASASAMPLQEEIMKARSAMREAVKSLKPQSTLDVIQTQIGGLHSKVAAVEAKTYAEILQMLTPEQRPQSDMAFSMIGMLTIPPRPSSSHR